MNEPSEKTKQFVEKVNNLIESGEVKNQQEIVKILKWDKTMMSNVLNGRRNVPNDVFKKFKDVYISDNHNSLENGNSEGEYQKKYIALLEKREKEYEILKEQVKEVLELLTKINTHSSELLNVCKELRSTTPPNQQ